MWITEEDINDLTAHHPPAGPEVAYAHDRVRQIVRRAMVEMNAIVPECPLKTRALNELQGAMLLANTAVAVVGNRDGLWRATVSDVMADETRLSSDE